MYGCNVARNCIESADNGLNLRVALFRHCAEVVCCLCDKSFQCCVYRLNGGQDICFNAFRRSLCLDDKFGIIGIHCICLHAELICHLLELIRDASKIKGLFPVESFAIDFRIADGFQPRSLFKISGFFRRVNQCHVVCTGVIGNSIEHLLHAVCDPLRRRCDGGCALDHALCNAFAKINTNLISEQFRRGINLESILYTFQKSSTKISNSSRNSHNPINDALQNKCSNIHNFLF